jgi:hypothetical protein
VSPATAAASSCWLPAVGLRRSRLDDREWVGGLLLVRMTDSCSEVALRHHAAEANPEARRHVPRHFGNQVRNQTTSPESQDPLYRAKNEWAGKDSNLRPTDYEWESSVLGWVRLAGERAWWIRRYCTDRRSSGLRRGPNARSCGREYRGDAFLRAPRSHLESRGLERARYRRGSRVRL